MDTNISVKENFTFYANQTAEDVAGVSLVFSCVFVVLIPYILFLSLLYLARKTDNRLPQHVIQRHMVGIGVICIFGGFIFSILTLMLQSSRNVASKGGAINILHTIFHRTFIFLLLNGPSIIETIYYYLFFLSVLQRVVLIAKAKVGMRLLTGRRLSCKIILVYSIAMISGILKIVTTRVPWLEIILLCFTAVLFAISCFLVRHLERKMIATMHITVLLQIMPLIVLQAIFTAAEIYSSSHENVITLHTVRSVNAFTLSFMTPLCLILGSWAKRRIVWAAVTCRWEEQHGRGEIYTAERSPVDISNAVSLSPVPTTRF